MLLDKIRQRMRRRPQHPPRRLVVIRIRNPQRHPPRRQIHNRPDHAVHQRVRHHAVPVPRNAADRHLERLVQQLHHDVAVARRPPGFDHHVGLRALRAVDEVVDAGGGRAGRAGWGVAAGERAVGVRVVVSGGDAGGGNQDRGLRSGNGVGRVAAVWSGARDQRWESVEGDR